MSSRQFFADIQFGSSDLFVSYGSGSPETNKAADISSLYIRSDATNSATSLYVKNSGTGNTGWVPIAAIPASGSAEQITFIGSNGNLSTATGFVWNVSSSSLGVNKTSPSAALHIYDNGEFTSRLIFETTSASNYPGVQFQWDSAGTRRVLIRGATVGSLGSEIEFFTKPDSGSAVANNMTIGANGDITFHNGKLFAPSISSGTQSNVIYYNTSTGEMTYGAAASGGGDVSGSGVANRVAYWSGTDSITSAADFLFNGSVLTVPSNAVANNLSINFHGDTSTGIQGVTGGQIAIQSSGDTVAVFSSHVSTTLTQFYGNVLVDNGHLNINDHYELQLQEDSSNGNSFVGIRANEDMTSASGTYILTLPAEAPGDDEILKWNDSSSSFEWVEAVNKNDFDNLETEVEDARSGQPSLLEKLQNLSRYAFGVILGPLNNQWYTNVRVSGNSGTTAFAAGRIDLVPYMSPVDLTIKTISVNTTTGATGNLRMGIYEADSLGRPSNLLWESGDISSAGNGNKSTALAFTFTACKMYWLCVHTSAAPVFRSNTIQSSIQFGLPSEGATNRFCILRSSQTYGALPDPWSYVNSQRQQQTGPIQFSLQADVS